MKARQLRLLFRHYSRFGLLLLLVILVIAAGVYFQAVLLPFVLAALLAYLLAPAVRWLNRLKVKGRHLHRGLAIVMIYAVFVAVVYVGGRFIVPSMAAEFNNIVRELPRMMVQVEREWVVPAEERINAWLGEFLPPSDGIVADPSFAPDGLVPFADENGEKAPDAREPWQVLLEDYTYVVRQMDGGRYEVTPRRKLPPEQEEQRLRGSPITMSTAFRDVREKVEGNFLELIDFGRRHVARIVNSFFTTFLVFMIAAFMLIAPDRSRAFLRTLVPAQYQDKFDGLVGQLDHGLSGVVRGQLVICGINGFFTGIGLVVLGVPFAITLTVIAMVFSLIPIFGVLISSIPIALMALSVSFSTAAMMMLWILMVHFIEGNFLNPKIMGDSSKIHPVLVIFALMVGQYSAGVLGALIAVPVFSLVQSSFLYLKSLAETWETAP